MIRSTSSRSKGFWMQWQAPRFMTSTAWETEPQAVIMMIWMSSSSFLKSSMCSRPSSPPSLLSSSTTSGRQDSARASPSEKVSAVFT